MWAGVVRNGLLGSWTRELLRYPDLHRLIVRLELQQAAEVREQILWLVTPPRGLRVLSVIDGPDGDLGQQSEEIIRNEAGGR